MLAQQPHGVQQPRRTSASTARAGRMIPLPSILDEGLGLAGPARRSQVGDAVTGVVAIFV
jgi:hypothetical protein